MAINQLPVPTSAGDNWVQIATTTPTSGTAVTFSSIATIYSKLMVMINAPAGGTLSANATIITTINGVTSGYIAPFVNIVTAGTLSTSVNNTGIRMTGALDSAGFIGAGFVTIESANTTTVKRVTGALGSNNGTAFYSFCDNGFFAGTAAVTSIALTLTGGASYTGGITFTLYGVRA